MRNDKNIVSSHLQVKDIGIPEKEIVFTKGVFEVKKGNQKIAEYVENGIIRVTKFGNIVFRTIESMQLMVCMEESRVLFINYA